MTPRLAVSPPLTLLKEILNSTGAPTQFAEGEILDSYQETLGVVHAALNTEIYENEPAWLYGAEFDTLQFSDAQYVVKDGQTASPGGTPYEEAEIYDSELGENRPLINDDMVLGVSLMQYEIDAGTYYVEDAENRVIYLDPITYGSMYMNPPVYIKPMLNQGWLGFIDVLFPELSACKPATTDLIDFGDIQDMIDEIYPTMADDPRLFRDPECVTEVPYDRILNRSSKAFLQGLILATIRIFCSTHLIKSLSVFTKFSPRFPETFSSVYAAYIVEKMEEKLTDAAGAGWELFQLFKDNDIWYQFLEQSVQTYSHMVAEEKVEPPPQIIAALSRLAAAQQRFDYKYRDDLKDAKEIDEVGIFKTLKGYRKDENLEAIYETQEDAKLIMAQLVMRELNFMSKKVISNLKIIGMTPTIKDIDYYILDNLSNGSSLTLNEAVNIDGSFTSTYLDLPIVPYDENDDADGPYYTGGGQFSIGEDLDETGLGEGEEYVGYYHVHLDEETGEVVYMAGEYHTPLSPQDILAPLVNIIQVPIGDVPELGTPVSADTELPFLVEKYISIDSGGGPTKYSTTDAIDIIKSNEGTALLSDIYPGDLELVYNDKEEPIGLTGNIGVRYGLQFYMLISSSNYTGYAKITSVEVDALDLPINSFGTLGSDSALLACLIRQLINDDKYKLLARYIVPLRKMISVSAIYVDMGFLSSIGEETVGDGQTWKTWRS